MADRYEFPHERQAANGDQMPEGLSLADQMVYVALSYIYSAYRAGIIDREKASYIKNELRASYEKSIQLQQYQDKLAEFRGRILKETEQVKVACRKDPSPENAILLCDVIDGIRGAGDLSGR